MTSSLLGVRCQCEVDPFAQPFDSPEAELSYLTEVAVQTNARIAKSLHVLARIRRRCNRLRSTIYSLPPEILSTVFQLLQSPSDNLDYGKSNESSREWESFPKPDFSAIILSSVSWHWRQVALATPRLWKSFALRMSIERVRRYTFLLQHYMTRAKPFNVSVNLSFGDCHIGEEASFSREYARLYSVLFSRGNAERVCGLRLHNPPLEWLSAVSNLSSLHTLCITFESDRSNGHSGASLHLLTHALRRLFLGNTNWVSVDVPPSLEFLTLSNVPPKLEMHLFQQCPELIEYYSDNPADYETIPELRFNTPLVFHHLSSLTWAASRGINDGSASEHVFLPALKKLHLLAPEPVQGLPVIGFIRNHGKTLHTLELDQFIEWGGRNSFQSLFCHEFPCLQHLAITQAPLPVLVSSIVALTPAEDELEEGKIPLPSMKFLRLGYNGNHHNMGDMSQIGQLVSTMLEFREAGEHSEFHLDITDFEDKEDLAWPLELKQKLNQYLSSTCHPVKITQEGKVPIWL
ncbi:hypothetical protein NP233_g3839 [Leucocoprinus birnbaumii]|uniref:F-box domain-containing protein n=1 Tax=Leucocoprinus birnbaumii TaxID=56174 RepID=A0AAD5YXP1_9AGAR|nr:hypothetical protein NP233_g3839 [Leucocoprinus birnbaumii]